MQGRNAGTGEGSGDTMQEGDLRHATIIGADAPLVAGTRVSVVRCNLGPDLWWLVAIDGRMVEEDGLSNLQIRTRNLDFSPHFLYAITTNIPGYSPEGDRTVARGEQNAAEAIRSQVDFLLDSAVEGKQMSDDEASSDLASIDAAIASGDLQYRMRFERGSTCWVLPELNLMVCATSIPESDLSDDERDYLDL